MKKEIYDYITDTNKNVHERIHFLEMEDEYELLEMIYGIVFHSIKLAEEDEVLENLKDELVSHCMKDGTDEETARNECFNIITSLWAPLAAEEMRGDE